MSVYSFIDTVASITGPGFVISLGYGAGVAEEGIDIVQNEETVKLLMGAGGEGMYSLLNDKSGKVTVRLLKTSPTNTKLMAAYDATRISSALVGQCTITVDNVTSGDNTTARSAAFMKKPDLHYAREGGIVEWEFIAIYIDSVLGVY